MKFTLWIIGVDACPLNNMGLHFNKLLKLYLVSNSSVLSFYAGWTESATTSGERQTNDANSSFDNLCSKFWIQIQILIFNYKTVVLHTIGQVVLTISCSHRFHFFSRPCLSIFFIKKKAVTDTILMRPNRAWPAQEHNWLKNKNTTQKQENTTTTRTEAKQHGEDKGHDPPL